MLLDDGDASGRPLVKICNFGYSINEKESKPKTNLGTIDYKGTKLLVLGKHLRKTGETQILYTLYYVAQRDSNGTLSQLITRESLFGAL
jgi:hypothetical protein